MHFAGHFVQRTTSPSPDIFNSRRTFHCKICGEFQSFLRTFWRPWFTPGGQNVRRGQTLSLNIFQNLADMSGESGEFRVLYSSYEKGIYKHNGAFLSLILIVEFRYDYKSPCCSITLLEHCSAGALILIVWWLQVVRQELMIYNSITFQSLQGALWFACYFPCVSPCKPLQADFIFHPTSPLIIFLPLHQ